MVELFDLGRQLKDKECGWREGVCNLLPALIELFGATNAHSSLATLLREAVKADYLKSSQIFRRSCVELSWKSRTGRALSSRLRKVAQSNTNHRHANRLFRVRVATTTSSM